MMVMRALERRHGRYIVAFACGCALSRLIQEPEHERYEHRDQHRHSKSLSHPALM